MFCKKVFVEILQNSQENTCARVFILMELPEACNFIKIETLAQVFSCEFCKISKNTFSYRTPQMATSVLFLKVVSKTNYFLRKLLFQSFYFLRGPIFSKQLYIFARATFLEDVVFQNIQFSTAKLVFTLTLYIYHLVIIPALVISD